MSLQTNTLVYYSTLQLEFCSICYSNYIASDWTILPNLLRRNHMEAQQTSKSLQYMYYFALYKKPV